MTDAELADAEQALDRRLQLLTARGVQVAGMGEQRLLCAVEALMDDDTRRRYREAWASRCAGLLDEVERVAGRAVLLGGGGGANGGHRPG